MAINYKYIGGDISTLISFIAANACGSGKLFGGCESDGDGGMVMYDHDGSAAEPFFKYVRTDRKYMASRNGSYSDSGDYIVNATTSAITAPEQAFITSHGILILDANGHSCLICRTNNDAPCVLIPASTETADRDTVAVGDLPALTNTYYVGAYTTNAEFQTVFDLIPTHCASGETSYFDGAYFLRCAENRTLGKFSTDNVTYVSNGYVALAE